MNDESFKNEFDSVWPGLNHYDESESADFFGRDEETDILIDEIARQQFCAIYGPSGVGKTSLILAGVFPKLRTRGWLPIRIRLDYADEEKSYAEQVETAVGDAAKGIGAKVTYISPPLIEGREETLWEWLHRVRILNFFDRELRILLFFDQFEEVFDGCKDAGRRSVWFADLSDLSENTIPKAVADHIAKSNAEMPFNPKEQSWRTVISIRDDKLSLLEEVASDYPVFRRNRIAVNRLSREQALKAVDGPGRNAFKKEHPNETREDSILAPGVSESIVTIVADNDSSANNCVDSSILSLVCRELDIRRQKEKLAQIDQSMLDLHGKDILKDFYDNVMSNQVSESTRDYLEDELVTENGVRDCLAVATVEKHGVPSAEWERLCEARILYKYQKRDIPWLEFSHDVLVKYAIESRNERKLRKEREAERKEQEAIREKLRHENEEKALIILKQKRHKIFWFCVGFVSIAVLAFMGIAKWLLCEREYKQYYGDFVRQYGVPIGIGQLSKEDVRSRFFSYCFHSKGWDLQRGCPQRPYLVEVICGKKDANGRFHPTRTTLHPQKSQYGGFDMERSSLTGLRPAWMFEPKWIPKYQGSNVSVEQIKAHNRLAVNLGRVSAWKYTYRQTGANKLLPILESAFDSNDKLIWQMQYNDIPSLSKENEGLEAMTHVVGADGFPLSKEDCYWKVSFAKATGALQSIECRKDGSKDDLTEQRRIICNAEGRPKKIYKVNNGIEEKMPQAEYEFSDAGLVKEKLQSPHGKSDEHFFYYERIREYDASNGMIAKVYYKDNSSETTDSQAFQPCDIWGDYGLYIMAVSFNCESNVPRRLTKSFECQPADDENDRFILRESWADGIAWPMTVEFFDVRNMPITNSYGIARIENSFDERGRLIRQVFRSPPGRGGAFATTNVSHVIYRYNPENSCVTNIAYFDKNNPCHGRFGAHELRMDYVGDRLAAQYYFNENGVACTNRFGAAGYRWESASTNRIYAGGDVMPEFRAGNLSAMAGSNAFAMLQGTNSINQAENIVRQLEDKYIRINSLGDEEEIVFHLPLEESQVNGDAEEHNEQSEEKEETLVLKMFGANLPLPMQAIW